MENTETTRKVKPKESPWENSSLANLVRWKSSNIYFARFKIDGRLIRKSLDTPIMSVARNRLAELIKQERQSLVRRKWACGRISRPTTAIGNGYDATVATLDPAYSAEAGFVNFSAGKGFRQATQGKR